MRSTRVYFCDTVNKAILTEAERKNAMADEKKLANLRASFDRFDTDKSGYIDREEMRAAIKFVCKQLGINEGVAIAEADAIIQDSNEVGEADDKVSFEEFVKLFGK